MIAAAIRGLTDTLVIAGSHAFSIQIVIFWLSEEISPIDRVSKS
jgi:hypothetical protein